MTKRTELMSDARFAAVQRERAAGTDDRLSYNVRFYSPEARDDFRRRASLDASSIGSVCPLASAVNACLRLDPSL